MMLRHVKAYDKCGAMPDTTNSPAPAQSPAQQRHTRHWHARHWRLGSPLRRARLFSGLILFTYVLTHLLNHALCNASIPAADAMLLVQKWIWQGVLGTAALYAALLVHMALGLLALYTRRNWRWSFAEAMQLSLGLAFPALFANHLAVTRGALTLYGLNKGYIAELASLWVTAPLTGWLQIAVLIAAWSHACLGLFFFLRLRSWFRAVSPTLLALAVLIPSLALLGYVQGGREIRRDLALPGFRAFNLPASVTGTHAQAAHLAALRDDFLIAWAAAIALVLLARILRRVMENRRGLVTLTYPSQRRVRVARGLSVLDASKLHRIPHASVCGGRGRCSTCRIRVPAGAALPPASAHERALLDSIGADPAQTRLACQLRPNTDLTIVPLIPPELAGAFVAGRHARTPGEERFVAAMFVDLRGSTALAQRRTAFDSVFLLGRFVTAVTQAIVESGGRPVQFLGDGVLALFGLECAPEPACRQALDAVAALRARLDGLHDLFMQETQAPLRYGIGLHCGRAIVGEIGFGRHVAFTALGETINTAHRLQELARDRDAEAVISAQVYGAAGVVGTGMEAAPVRGRAAVMDVQILRAQQEVIAEALPQTPLVE
jgi:adenylate cyclase